MRVFCCKSTPEVKLAARKFEFSGKTQQINIDLENYLWLDPFSGG